MANLGYTFDPDSVPDDDYIFPDYDGMAQAISSEIEEVDSIGSILQVSYEIMDGPMAKRQCRQGFLIRDGGSNAQWFDISQKQLKSLTKAVNHVGPLRDSGDLHFKPFRLVVTQSEKNGKRRNNFKHYQAGAASGPTSGGNPAPQPAGGVPWAQTAA